MPLEKQKHYTLSDDVFIHQFETLTLPENWFTHEAHLRLAYILIKRQGLKKSIQKICTQIKNFDQHFGDGTKYHHTLTMAAIKTINYFIQKSNSNNFNDLLLEFPRLKNDFYGLLRLHYSAKVFKNSASKINYIEPDLIPYK